MNVTSIRVSLGNLLLVGICLFQAGCAMCTANFDEAYGGHGGKWQRSDAVHGRVGSPFSDPLIDQAIAGDGKAPVAAGEDSSLDDQELADDGDALEEIQ